MLRTRSRLDSSTHVQLEMHKENTYIPGTATKRCLSLRINLSQISVLPTLLSYTSRNQLPPLSLAKANLMTKSDASFCRGLLTLSREDRKKQEAVTPPLKPPRGGRHSSPFPKSPVPLTPGLQVCSLQLSQLWLLLYFLQPHVLVPFQKCRY